LLASRLSESSLELLGYSVLREGNILNLPHQRLSVVEACSGIRSLVTLSFVCVSYAYFFTERWLKPVIVLAAIPAAILLNAARITLTGLLGENHPHLTQGLYHEMLGWICFVAAFGFVFLFHHILRRLLQVQSDPRPL
jgi:exosortase